VIVRAEEVLMNPDTVHGEGRLHAQKKARQCLAFGWLCPPHRGEEWQWD